jgi:hypothetical protein
MQQPAAARAGLSSNSERKVVPVRRLPRSRGRQRQLSVWVPMTMSLPLTWSFSQAGEGKFGI